MNADDIIFDVNGNTIDVLCQLKYNINKFGPFAQIIGHNDHKTYMASLILNKYDVSDIINKHFRMGSFTADDVISFTVSNYDAGLSLLPQTHSGFNSSVVKIQINTPLKSLCSILQMWTTEKGIPTG